MGKFADVIRNCVAGKVFDAVIIDFEQAEKEIIELIEKLIPKQENGNVALYRIGYNDCRKDIKQNLRLQN